ncbi:hypothetical protein QL285_011727 [Trifolium repens]|nr:hypothetical protein QL285_011727 [Trifolium repens]
MAQIAKFVSALIIFLSMFLIVTYCGGSGDIHMGLEMPLQFVCQLDEDCEVMLCDLPLVSKCISHSCSECLFLRCSVPAVALREDGGSLWFPCIRHRHLVLFNYNIEMVWMGGGGLFWTRIWCRKDLWTGDIKGGG